MYLFSTLFVCSLISCLHGQVIDEHPLPLLIPINEAAVFSCRAHCINKTCTSIHWVINNTSLESENERSMSGFIFSLDKNRRNEYITILTVNATEVINNTVVYCVFEESGDEGGSNHSHNATLLVITESPISANPSIKKNSTHLSLLWSPPFLWPGQRIDYYNISFVNKSDGSITYYDRVNSTFSDQVVKFIRKIRQNEMCTSTEIEFGISAVNVSGYLLPTVNISDWISPSPYIDVQSNWSAAITTSLLKNDTTSVLIVDFKLPTLKCASVHQELNYTLMVYSEREELVTQFGPVEYYMHGSKNVSQTVDSPNIEENQSYSLTVQVDIYAQTVTSYRHNFDTFNPEMDQTTYMAGTTTTHTATSIALTTETDTEAPEVRATSNDFISSYKIVFWICLSIITILLLVLMIMIVCVAHLCSHRFKRRAYIANRRSKDTKARACNNMVHNPIYAGLSGPVYDSIWPPADSFDGNHMSPTANHRPNATTTTTGKTALRRTSDEYQPCTARHKDSLLW